MVRLIILLGLASFVIYKFRRSLFGGSENETEIPTNVTDLKLTQEQKNNAISIMKWLKFYGVTDDLIVAGILAEIFSETNLIPQNEKSYAKTDSTRLKSTIFTSKLKDLSIPQIDELKKNDIAFFARVYGGQYGNDNAGDGYAYRGRGFNQVTFKAGYQALKDALGIDFVKNPEQLNDPDIAARAVAKWFSTGLKLYLKSKEALAVGVDSLEAASYAALRINAGMKKNLNTPFYRSLAMKILGYAKYFLIFVRANKQ